MVLTHLQSGLRLKWNCIVLLIDKTNYGLFLYLNPHWLLFWFIFIYFSDFLRMFATEKWRQSSTRQGQTLSLQRQSGLRWRYYLILHCFPAIFNVPISQDNALFVHSGLLLPVLFKHPDFQATSKDDGSITYI